MKMKKEIIFKKIGLMQKSKYVCLIMRDSKYKKTLNDEIDYNYHSFRNVNRKIIKMQFLN